MNGIDAPNEDVVPTQEQRRADAASEGTSVEDVNTFYTPGARPLEEVLVPSRPAPPCAGEGGCELCRHHLRILLREETWEIKRQKLRQKGKL